MLAEFSRLAVLKHFYKILQSMCSNFVQQVISKLMPLWISYEQNELADHDMNDWSIDHCTEK